MSLENDLLSQWGGKNKNTAEKTTQVKRSPVRKKIEKKTVNNKPKPENKKVVNRKEEPVDFNKTMKNIFAPDNSDYSGDMGDLIEESNKAKLRQEILKAEQLEYKVEQEDLKLKKESGNLIEYDLANFLFIGFMEKTNLQLLGLIKKLEPDLINLCRENEPQELLRLLITEIEAIVIDIKNQQKKDVANWEKER